MEACARMPRFGRFHIESRLARGGMCDVFRVTATDGNPVRGDLVLKVLLPELARDGTALRLFENEGLIGTALRHPNIVRVYEHGVLDGRHYILMEHVDGVDLGTLLHRLRKSGRALPHAAAVLVVTGLLRGLDHAHFSTLSTGQPLGVLHRDVSPDNTFCTATGVVKLGDFGIAKMSAMEPFTDPRLGIKGKLLYMAPERIRGEPHDGRSDCFSAALLLYELFTGVQPYASRPGEKPHELSKRVAEADIPRARKLSPAVPRRVDAVIMKALSRDPSSRPPTCGAFAQELEDAARAESLQPSPAALAAIVQQVR